MYSVGLIASGYAQTSCVYTTYRLAIDGSRTPCRTPCLLAPTLPQLERWFTRRFRYLTRLSRGELGKSV